MSFRLELSHHGDASSADAVAERASDLAHTSEIVHIVSEIERYQTAVEYFYSGTDLPPLDSDHDTAHIARALVLAALLVRRAEVAGKRIDRDVVYWSLIFHDICSNEADMPDHGDHAAELIAPHVTGSALFTEFQAAQIVENVKYHNKKHSSIPEHVWTDEFHIMTNADALDLVRIPADRVGDILLTTRDAWEIRFTADTLYRESSVVRVENTFENVLLAALEL